MSFLMRMIAILAALMQLSSSAMAQDFLQELDARTKEAATEYNSRFIDEHRYFAKRYRIVEINTAVLHDSTIDGIRLFEGEQDFDLRRERLYEGQIHGAAIWIGNIVLPNESSSDSHWSEADLDQVANSGFTTEQIIAQIGRVELHMLYWDIDSNTGEAYPSAEQRHRQLGPTAIGKAAAGDVEEYAFASVTGQIDLSILGLGTYRLEPLRNSPRYHILYEVDTTRTFGVVEVEPGARKTISTDAQKKLDYDAYLESLPPRSVVITKGDL